MDHEHAGQVSNGQLQHAMRRDQEHARSRGEFRELPGGGRLHMQVSMEAVMNAVNTEGREVLGAEAAGYWEDQKRLYPWTNTMPDKHMLVTGLRNRLGKVKQRTVYHRDGTKTVMER